MTLEIRLRCVYCNKIDPNIIYILFIYIYIYIYIYYLYIIYIICMEIQTKINEAVK